MKTRKGLPLKKDMEAIIDRHGLAAKSLDMWTIGGTLAYSGRRGADDKASAVADELRSNGFEVEHKPANKGMYVNGVVRVTPKRKAEK